MGTIIFIGIALWFLTEIFPGVFDFIGVIFSFLWDLVGTIVMFFVNLLGGILPVVGGAMEWLMTFLGNLLTPALEMLPDTPLIPLAVIVGLGILFLLMKPPGEILGRVNMNIYAKLTYAWCFSAFNLGMVGAGSGNPLAWMSGAIDTYITDFPMTLLNFAQWNDFAKTMLYVTLIGGMIVSVIFLLTKGLRSFLRTWVGLAFCCSLGYGYLSVRLVITDWLADNLGFVGKMLNIPIGFLEFIIIIQFFLGIVMFLLPMGAIQAINAMNRERHMRSAPVTSEEPEDPLEEDSNDTYPVYVSDDAGNHYSVSIDGDFIYINYPNGRISTKWEYVKGNPYFDLHGNRFYPHY